MDTDQPLRNRVILFADDEPRLRMLVTMMLEDLGAQVIAVESGEEAVAAYAERQSDIDLVMLDMRMKGMGGEKAFAAIKQMAPKAKIVLSSGILPDAALLATIHSAGGAFIEKPFDLDVLSHTLSALLSPQ
ncbi:MAG: response regulator [Myxococcales bacterium]|nr:response regulator [Myxococcales bacterium]